MSLVSTQCLREMCTSGIKRALCGSSKPHRNFSAICLENVEFSTSQNSMDLYGLLQG
jgi:hypothetical protein